MISLTTKRIFPQGPGYRAFHPSPTLRRIPLEFWNRNFLKRVPLPQRELLTNKINARSSLCEQSQNMKDIFARNWNADLFRGEEGVLTSLQMYKENLLNDEAMAHIFLYDSCKDLSEFRCYNTKSAKPWHEALRHGFKRLKDPKMDQSIEKLDKQLHLSDLEIFSYQAPFLPDQEICFPGAEESLLYNIFETHTFMPTIYNPDTDPTGLEVLILHPKLLFQLLSNRFPLAMKPIPVLGYRAEEKLSDPDKRVMSISSRFSPALQVHTTRCHLDPTMYFHDMYHLFIESANPHRKAWIELALFVRKMKEGANHPEFNIDFLNEVEKALLDREFFPYMSLYTESKIPPTDIFMTILTNFPHKFLNFMNDQLLWSESGGLCDHLISHIRENQARWASEYGIQLPNSD